MIARSYFMKINGLKVNFEIFILLVKITPYLPENIFCNFKLIFFREPFK